MEGERRLLIESIGLELPERGVTTDEVLAGCVVPLRFPFEKMTGIRSRRVAAEGQFCVDLARSAIEDCLARSRHEPQSVELLISASISHFDAPGRVHSFEPATSLRLKRDCGLDGALAFDVSNGCAGLWTAILIAEALMRVGAVERALLVAGEYVTDLIRTAQREIGGHLDPQVPSLTMGDAAVALLVEATDRADAGLELLDLYTLGAYSDYCVVRPTGEPHGGGVMVTDSIRIGARAMQHVVAHLADSLDEAGRTADDVDWLIAHQTSETTLLDALRRINRRLAPSGFPAERFLINLRERGNTATTTHFVALRDAIAEGRMSAGDRTAFSITGSGLSIGTALYRFDELPERLRNGASPSRGKRGPHVGSGAATRAASREPVSITAMGLVRGEEAASCDSVELCRRAALDCLERASIAPGDVDLLIHAGVYRTDFLAEPAVAALVAGALDLNAASPPSTAPRSLAFDLLAGHLGALKACDVAARLVLSGRSTRVLVLTSDVENNEAGAEWGLYGLEPAGGALLVEAGERGLRLGRFAFRDELEHLNLFSSYFENPDGRYRLTVERDPGFVDQAAVSLARTARALAEAEGVALGDLAQRAVLVPAGLEGLREQLAGDLGVPEEWLVDAGADRDLVSTSLVAGLSAAAAVEGVERLLVLALGAGVQTGCCLIRRGSDA